MCVVCVVCVCVCFRMVYSTKTFLQQQKAVLFDFFILYINADGMSMRERVCVFVCVAFSNFFNFLNLLKTF